MLRQRTAELFQQCRQNQLGIDDAVQQQMLMMDALAPTVIPAPTLLGQPRSLFDDPAERKGCCRLLKKTMIRFGYAVLYTAQYIFFGIMVIVVLYTSLSIFGHFARAAIPWFWK